MVALTVSEASLNGQLYALLPKEVVKLTGSPIITGTCYECEKLRCTLCGNQYEAELPRTLQTARNTMKLAISDCYCSILRWFAS